jgi:hypothetical protein
LCANIYDIGQIMVLILATTCTNIQCSIDVCKNQLCNSNTNEFYLCTEDDGGGEKNGCSSDAQFWINAPNCLNCCDVRTCQEGMLLS